jgi:hypothetical protein
MKKILLTIAVFSFVCAIQIVFAQPQTGEQKKILESEQKLHETNITIAPNPANNFLTITAPSGSTITISSIIGRTIYTSQLSSPIVLDVSTWSNGIYLVKITYDENGRTLTQVQRIYIKDHL